MDGQDEDGASLVVYEQDGVLLTSKAMSSDSSNLHLGKLRIVQEKNGVFIVWISDDNSAAFHGSQEPDWAVVDSSRGSAGYHGGPGRPIRFEVDDLKCIFLSSLSENSNNIETFIIAFKNRAEGLPSRKNSSKADPARTCNVTFVQTDGTTHASLIFPGDSTTGLLDALTHHLTLKRSCQDDSMILCEPKASKMKRESYERSLAELRLFPDRPSLNPYARLGQLGQIGVGAWRFVNDLKRDPYATTLTAFSKISDYLLHEYERPNEEIAELLHRSLSLDDSTRNRTLSDSDENNLVVGSYDSSVEGYEVIQPPAADLIPRPVIRRGGPLTEAQWMTYIDEEGRISNEKEIKAIIFSGGVEPSLRSEVWKFVLGYYPWHSTMVERKELRDSKVEEYFKMKLQWRSISGKQESRFAAFKQRKDLIEKDVNRTDRTIPYYAGENNEHVSTLRDVLMTYMMYDFDLGYVQGMSDLLAPILYILDDEVDAFWCFASLMDRVCLNFVLDQTGIKKQLAELRTLLHTTDPHLASYLETRESGNLFFCFRWLLVLFKREFNYPQILRLWEVLWTDGPFYGQDLRPSTNFHLIIALAILDSQRNTILENKFGFTEILKHVNDLALYIDLEETLTKAEGIFIQLKESPSVSSEVRHIIGLETAETSPIDTDSSIEQRFETALSLHYL